MAQVRSRSPFLTAASGYEKHEKPPFKRTSSANSVTGPWPSRERNWFRLATYAWIAISVYPVLHFFFWSNNSPSPGAVLTPRETVTKTIILPQFPETALKGALPTDPPADAYRATDAIDIFEDFERSERCHLSSLDLHGPFEPLCQDKESLLRAMAWGGRIGIDAPFSPRGCDMRWFSPPEICQILSRFSRVNIMGDSMMRNLAIGMQVYLRASLVNGGRTSWLDDPEGADCSCQGVFDDRGCAFHAVVQSSVGYRFAPESYVCKEDQVAPVEYHNLLEHPIKADDLEGFANAQSPTRPIKPAAFVMGHGLWNDLNAEKTIRWIWQVHNSTIERAPYLGEPNALFARLFVTPNAAGDKKPDIFIARQGNIALTRFEKHVGQWVRNAGFDHLGTYNMSIQAFNPDGTHGGFRVNLIKAMMVFNWLNAIDTTKH